MNKEFRAWNGKEYLDPEYWKITSSGYENYAYDGIELIIEQWTGLKDKNGIKIFEGDIVRYYHVNEVDNFTIDAILLCKYTLDNAWFSFCSSLEDDNEGYYWGEIKGNCEVIGNIHENPELKLRHG